MTLCACCLNPVLTDAPVQRIVLAAPVASRSAMAWTRAPSSSCPDGSNAQPRTS